jgi:hypothetical protein
MDGNTQMMSSLVYADYRGLTEIWHLRKRRAKRKGENLVI